MAEAASRIGQFAGMPEEFVLCKINELLEVIKKYDPDGVFVFLDWSEYRKILEHRVVPESLQNPYHLLFPGIFDVIRISQTHKGIFPEPIDVDFDEQGSAGAFAQLRYPAMKANCDPEVRKMLGRVPIMLDDKKVMPLQAADMLAWNIRREHDMDDDGLAWHWLFEALDKHIYMGAIMTEETLSVTLRGFPVRGGIIAALWRITTCTFNARPKVAPLT